MKLTVLTSIITIALVTGAPLQNAEYKDGRFSLLCTVCDLAVEILFNSLEQGTPLANITNSLVDVCLTLDLYPEPVCRGVLDITLPTLLYIQNHTTLDRGNICGIVLMDGNCTLSNAEELEWSIVPSDVLKPPVVEPEVPLDGPTLKVLHLSDVHYDPQYVVGSNANCSEPLCCRATSGEVTDPVNAAGLWGDYRNCDMPWRTIEQAMQHICQQHPDIDYIVWTGDLTPHAVWATSKEENLFIIERIVGVLRQYFPGVPIYPSLGNHESHPVNTFAPPEITDPEYSTQWLYDAADEQWSFWLPEETATTIRYGGYYTTLIKPGLRIVSLNNNYCYTYNWWLLYKSQDPASTLLWLSQVLQEAENNNEKVQIISHIPPGNHDCWTIFSREFTKLVSRYESTISAQFYGHTHNDEFRVFFDVDDPSRPVSSAFIGPSLTVYSDINPGYKIYTLDGERQGSSFAVLDHSTWIMNLTAANLNGEADPVWWQLYTAKETFSLDSMRPRDLYDLVNRMIADDSLFQLYYKHYVKSGDPSMAEGCDEKCRFKLLCGTVTSNYLDQSHCESIREKLFGHQEF